MRKIFKLPTLVGLIVLLIGIASGIFLINRTSVFKLGAQQEASPKSVRVTNITDTSVTVTWTTDLPSQGLVKWGDNKTILSKVAIEDSDQDTTVHSSTLTPINPNTDVFFKISSNGTDWDNEGIAWQSKTLAQTIASTQTTNATGSIVNQSGDPPASALVLINVSGITLSTLTSVNGSWIIPVSNYVEVDQENTPLEISVNATDEGSATAVIYPKAAKNTPLIVLGKTYDFRTISTEEGGEIPKSDLSLPESIERSSRFEVGNTSTPSQTEVTLESIDDGEIVTTTDPEFFGDAPTGTEIEVLVESEPQVGTVTATKSGWNWSPPENLDPGEHTVTVRWRDEGGILRTLTRTFVVSAAEGPAFVSTPSATPTQTSTPTSSPNQSPTSLPSATPAVTPSQTPEVSSTPASLPDSGTLTPTLVLFIMGLGAIMTSIFVWKKADA